MRNRTIALIMGMFVLVVGCTSMSVKNRTIELPTQKYGPAIQQQVIRDGVVYVYRCTLEEEDGT